MQRDNAPRLTKRCAYCVDGAGGTTDHVFPSSWYPKSTPSHIQRWTVPSCGPCNNRWSPIEEDVGLRLSATIDAEHEASIGIWQNFRRAVSPSVAPNAREIVIRSNRLQNLLAEFLPAKSVVQTAVLPHSRTNENDDAHALLLDAESLEGLLGKFVRGAHYHITKRPLPKLARFDFQVSSPQALAELMSRFGQYAQTFDLGPGIWFCRFDAKDSTRYGALYVFVFWRQIYFYVGVSVGRRGLRHL